MSLEGVFNVHVEAVAPVKLYPGVRLRTLLSSESPTGTKVQFVEIDPDHGREPAAATPIPASWPRSPAARLST